MAEAKVSSPEVESSCSTLCGCAMLLSPWRSVTAEDGSTKVERHLATPVSFRESKRRTLRNPDIVGRACGDIIGHNRRKYNSASVVCVTTFLFFL